MLGWELVIIVASVGLGILSKWQSDFTTKEAIFTAIRLFVIFNIAIVLGFIVGLLVY